MLKIYNNLSNKKETFTPIEANKIRMYVCGMTVYDHCHLGHARVMVAFDVVFRYLKASGYDVTYIRNITLSKTESSYCFTFDNAEQNVGGTKRKTTVSPIIFNPDAELQILELQITAQPNAFKQYKIIELSYRVLEFH